MKLSNYIFTTDKFEKSTANNASDRLLRGCYCVKHCSGIYSYSNLGIRVLRNIEQIIRKHMDNIGCHEVQMPLLQDLEVWKRSKRQDKYGKELFSLKDRKDRLFCLAPTAEETAVELAEHICVKKQHYPFSIYQIGIKYRDELRPRGGLLRGREFMMKDAYSFALTHEDSIIQYKQYIQAYIKIFTELELEFYIVPAETGAVGGDFSHEFISPSNQLGIGSEDVYYDSTYSHNQDNINNLQFLASREPNYTNKFKGIELGHTYALGKKYSETMKMKHPGDDYPYMGCYGIGSTRILALLLLEKKYLPLSVSPFKFYAIVLNNQFNQQLENSLENILIDDRDIKDFSFGTKKNDHELIGVPYLIIIGKNFEFINYITNKTNIFNNIEDLIDFCNKI